MGSLGAGIAGTTAAKSLADKFVKEDSEHLVELLQKEIGQLASKYMLTEDEFESILTEIDEKVDPKWLCRMFKQKDQSIFLRVEFEYLFREIVQKRPKIALPSVEQLGSVIEDIRLETT